MARGFALADLSWVYGYENELERMNDGKEGRPFRYGGSLILFVSRLKASASMTFRILEGFLRTFTRSLLVHERYEIGDEEQKRRYGYGRRWRIRIVQDL